MQKITPPEGFRHSFRVYPRFSDFDMMAHINNTRYLTYAEDARIAYMEELLQAQLINCPVVALVAHLAMDYKRPVTTGQRVYVFTRTVRLGNKSFEQQSQLVAQDEMEGFSFLAAQGKTVMVCYDVATEKAVPIPETWRKLLVEFEAGVIT